MSQEIGYKKILVTGAGGQLGQAAISKLLDYKVKIIALDRLPPEETPLKVTPLTVDLTSAAQITEARDELKDVDCLIHLASIVTDSIDVIRDAPKSVNTEILGTLTLLKYLPNLKSIIYASSYMVYGPTIFLPITEEHPTDPINIYGVTKLAAEKLLKLYGREAGIPVINLRFSGIYGPGTHIFSGRLIASLIRTVGEGSPPQIFGDGTEHREALYMDDAVSGIVDAVLASRKNISGTFNISAGEQYTASELAELIIELFCRPELKPEYKPGAAQTGSGLTDLEIDISKAKEQLGYQPKFNLKDGLKEHIEWYKDQIVDKE
jgi:UDP-glucose 4-epimerase